jgi:hypothetical protein
MLPPIQSDLIGWSGTIGARRVQRNFNSSKIHRGRKRIFLCLKNSFVTATWSHHHQQCSSVAFSCIAISCANILPGAEIHLQHCKLQCLQQQEGFMGFNAHLWKGKKEM